MTTEKPELAIRALEGAVEADANLLDAKYNLALAYEMVGKRVEAKGYLRELDQVFPADAEVKAALERLSPKDEPVNQSIGTSR